MKLNLVNYLCMGLLVCSTAISQADNDVDVLFNYDDVRHELINSDQLTKMLIQMGAIDAEEEQLAYEQDMMERNLSTGSELSLLARNPRRVIGDTCRPGERCHVIGRPGQRPPQRPVRPVPPARPIRPAPPRRPVAPRPPHNRYPSYNYVCYAENHYGETFSAVGEYPSIVQSHAMDRCYQRSYQCYALGCY